MVLNILAFDTSTESCSVAIYHNGQLFYRELIGEQRQHSQAIFPLIAQLLRESELTFADLTAIAFGQGPGSFTGLRLAAAIAQGFAFAHNLPIIAVSTLDALANSYFSQYKNDQKVNIFATIDARMNELYGCFYQIDQQKILKYSEEMLMSPNEMVFPENVDVNLPLIGVGSGMVYRDSIEKNNGYLLESVCLSVCPQAKVIATLAAEDFLKGRLLSAEQALPIYLRNKVTK